MKRLLPNWMRGKTKSDGGSLDVVSPHGDQEGSRAVQCMWGWFGSSEMNPVHESRESIAVWPVTPQRCALKQQTFPVSSEWVSWSETQEQLSWDSLLRPLTPWVGVSGLIGARGSAPGGPLTGLRAGASVPPTGLLVSSERGSRLPWT